MTKHNYFFLSGLPRSGSTLLTSLLSENPEIHAEGNSPLLQYLRGVHDLVTNAGREQLAACNKYKIVDDMVRSIPDQYYANTEKKYVIDKSRVWTWTQNIELLKAYVTPDPKIIVMVRPIEQILISFINMYKKNNRVDYNINAMLVQGSDPIMKAYECLKMAMVQNPKHCLFVTYDYFINNTEQTLEAIYKFLGLEPFKHDLSNITNRSPENDNVYGLLGLHDVRKSISQNKYDITLPDDIVEHCKKLNKAIGLP